MIFKEGTTLFIINNRNNKAKAKLTKVPKHTVGRNESFHTIKLEKNKWIESP